MFRRGENETPNELGFSLLKSFQRQGYGTEAIGELVRHLREDQKFDELFAATQDTNIGCQKTLLKVGLVRAGYVEMEGVDGPNAVKLFAYTLPGMKPLEGQRLVSVGSTLNFDEEDDVVV